MGKKELTGPEWAARDRVARQVILLNDTGIIDLNGGTCWPVGSFDGGHLVKSRNGKFYLCDVYSFAEETKYDRIELPIEAVAAALIGCIWDDDVGYDTVHFSIAETTFERLHVHPGELAWWAKDIQNKVLKLNGMEPQN